MNSFCKVSLYILLFLSLTSAQAFITTSSPSDMPAEPAHQPTAHTSQDNKNTIPPAKPRTQQPHQNNMAQAKPQVAQTRTHKSTATQTQPQTAQTTSTSNNSIAKTNTQTTQQTSRNNLARSQSTQTPQATTTAYSTSDQQTPTMQIIQGKNEPKKIAQMEKTSSPIHMEIYKDGPLVLGQPTSIIAYIYDKNGGIKPEQLSPVRHNHFRLTLIDPSLSRMMSVYPVATDRNGFYKFNLTFDKPGQYTILGEITDAQGHVYAPSGSLTLPGKPQLLSKSSHIEPGTIEKHQTVDDLQFSSTMTAKKIHANQLVILDISVKHMTGEFHKGLEPHMNHYAHLIGVNENKTIVFHGDPINRTPASLTQRGGPDVRFKLRFPEPGFYRLWAQFQIDGRPVTVPYDVEVLP